MGQNKKKSFKLEVGAANTGHFAFSTDPNQKQPQAKGGAVSAKEQHLKIWLEKKGRGGKTASVVKEFAGKEEELKELAKALKAQCGTGGSVKEGEIIVQGDHRQKMKDYLTSKGYHVKLAGG